LRRAWNNLPRRGRVNQRSILSWTFLFLGLRVALLTLVLSELRTLLAWIGMLTGLHLLVFVEAVRLDWQLGRLRRVARISLQLGQLELVFQNGLLNRAESPTPAHIVALRLLIVNRSILDSGLGFVGCSLERRHCKHLIV
jgi:hypothetical protein